MLSLIPKTHQYLLGFSFVVLLMICFPLHTHAAKSSGGSKPKPTQDTTAPTVAITSPISGSVYTSAQTVAITASVSDNIGISKVEFYDNGVLKGSVSTSPFVYNWVVSSSLTNGNHTWSAKAYDLAGNLALSSPVDLVVNFPLACIDSGEPVCNSSLSCSERMVLDGVNTLEVYRNYSLSAVHCSVTHAVVVVHGRDRNPDDYFSYVMNAASAAGHSSDTLIVSPYFREQNDTRIESDFYWNRSAGSASQYDWAMGGQAYAPLPISSYEAVDKIISFIGASNRFPNLKSITVVGHSAGGQLVQRYAVSGNFNDQGLNKKISYVVANPSSYAYLNEQRPVAGSLSAFAVPDSSNCSSYNKWGYGLLNPNSYVSKLDSSQLRTQYVGRQVTYLLGDADILSDGMDVTCAANIQGLNRYERGSAYFNFMNSFFPENHHSKLIVPGVGHSGSAMIQSTQGISVIFPPQN